jgi:hypothetical protein
LHGCNGKNKKEQGKEFLHDSAVLPKNNPKNPVVKAWETICLFLTANEEERKYGTREQERIILEVIVSGHHFFRLAGCL